MGYRETNTGGGEWNLNPVPMDRESDDLATKQLTISLYRPWLIINSSYLNQVIPALYVDSNATLFKPCGTKNYCNLIKLCVIARCLALFCGIYVILNTCISL